MLRTISKAHTYEELRGVVIDILTGAEKTPNDGNYDNLVWSVGDVLARRGEAYHENPMASMGGRSAGVRIQASDVELIRDIFWDLFRQGFITIGKDENSQQWPWFRLSHHARETLLAKSPFRFHDITSYLKLVRGQADDISPRAVLYLEEAIRTYYSDCLLACCVMVGVAAEVEFIRMIEHGANNAIYSAAFASAMNQRQISGKIREFQKALPKIPADILSAPGESWDTHLTAIQEVLRVARNDAGHGFVGTPPLREQVYVYLQIFVPFVGYVSRLRRAL